MRLGLKALVGAVLLWAAPCLCAQDYQDLSLKDNIDTPAVTKRAVTPVQKYMQHLANKLGQHKFDVKLLRNDQVVMVTIPCSLLFAPNEETLTENGKRYLRPFDSLMKYPTMYKILVAVHTDNTGDEEYQTELSEARALAISDFWHSDSGYEAKNVVPYGIGAEEPLVPNNSIKNRDANRRVEIYIVPADDMVKTASAGKLKVD